MIVVRTPSLTPRRCCFRTTSSWAAAVIKSTWGRPLRLMDGF